MSCPTPEQIKHAQEERDIARDWCVLSLRLLVNDVNTWLACSAESAKRNLARLDAAQAALDDLLDSIPI